MFYLLSKIYVGNNLFLHYLIAKCNIKAILISEQIVDVKTIYYSIFN